MDFVLYLELAAFVGLLGLSAFFSSSETSLFSLTDLQLEQMRRDGDPSVPLISQLLAQPRQLIVTILIGNEFVNVCASVISASVAIKFFGGDGRWINLLVMIPILLLVGEITPKTLAIRNNVAFAKFQCHFIDLFARAIAPVRWVVRSISGFFITLVVGKERSRANILTEDMVRSLAAEAVGDGALDSHEALYINRIFDFGDTLLRDIVTPRSQVLFLPANATVEEAARYYRRIGHTKVPVYEERPDRIIGVLYVRDLVGVGLDAAPDPSAEAPRVRDIVRPAYFVPESKPVADLFYSFQKRQLSLALTIDEYGGVTGLVTMEDLLECIFGEIVSSSEELRQQRVKCEKLGEGYYRIDGTMTLRQFNTLFSAELDAGPAETIGGVLLNAFGELPAIGSRIVVSGYEFTVEAVTEQRIAGLTVEAKFGAAMADPADDPAPAASGPRAEA